LQSFKELLKETENKQATNYNKN